ncbi:MAG: FGGY-family carbohydrate kinase [Chloroflexi bacterium]|nr:FGGY-family carbohydrate kinase [Chloroflexota bacterium]
MPPRCFLGLDLGTSSLKAVVADAQGVVLGTASREPPYLTPEGASPLAREFSPKGLWRTLCELAREALSRAGAGRSEVAAIGVTSQRQGMAFLDTEGGELYLGPNLDLRAVFEGASLDEAHRAEVYRTTGHLPSLFFAPARLRWFQLTRPEVYEQIARVFTLADWASYRLTGVCVAEAALAGEAGLLDIKRHCWAVGLMERLGLRTDWFPPLVEAGVPVGGLQPTAADALGLPAGIPVTIAGPDTQCALLGLGVAEPGQAGVVAGWSVTVQLLTSRPLLDHRRRTWSGCWLWPGRWTLEASTGDAGNAYRWLTGLLFPPDSSHAAKGDAFHEMDRLAAEATPGAEGVLAFLGPAPLDLSRAGLRAGGFITPVPFTFSNLGRGHLARAGLENIAFAVRASCARLEGLSGSPISTLALGGGMARSSLFPQLLADVLNRELGVAGADASLVGAALAAAVATGHYPSLAEAAAPARARLRRLQPDPATALEYDGLYQRWLRVLGGLRRIGVG